MTVHRRSRRVHLCGLETVVCKGRAREGAKTLKGGGTGPHWMGACFQRLWEVKKLIYWFFRDGELGENVRIRGCGTVILLLLYYVVFGGQGGGVEGEA